MGGPSGVSRSWDTVSSEPHSGQASVRPGTNTASAKRFFLEHSGQLSSISVGDLTVIPPDGKDGVHGKGWPCTPGRQEGLTVMRLGLRASDLPMVISSTPLSLLA